MRKDIRLADRLLSFIGVRLVIWLIVAKAFLPGVLNDPVDKIAYHHDEHADILGEESARRSYVDYHQLPQWEPHWCGGVVGLGNAGSLAVAPDFLLRIIYGTLAGRRLAVLLFVLLGMEGTYRYARHNKASALGAAAGAVAFSCSGSFPPMLGLGWGFMFHFNLLPWALLGFERGLVRKRWIVIGGLAMAWMLLGAGTYALPYTIFVMGLLVLFETIRTLFDRSEKRLPWWRPIGTFVGIGVVGGLLCAIRLLPLLNLLATHERLVQQKDQTGPLVALAMMILPREHASWGTGAGEYYIGTVTFGFALLAILFRDRRAVKFWAIALLIAVIACGEFIDTAPYLLMRKLPIYSQLRFPVRWLTVAGFFFVMAGTVGLSRVEDAFSNVFEIVWSRIARWKPERLAPRMPVFGRALLNVCAAFVAAYLAIWAGQDVYEKTAVQENTIYYMDGPQIVDQPFRQSRGNRWDAQVWVYANLGSLHCFDENQLFESPYLRADLPQEEYPAPGNPEMTVERVSWSPQEIVVKVHAPATGGRFLVNMNHNASWHTDVGTLSSDGGLISVKVPEGDHVVTLRFRDWRVVVGGIISFAMICAILFFAFRLGRDRVRVYRRFWRFLDRRKSDLPSAPDALRWVAGERGAIASTRNIVLIVFAVHLLLLGRDVSQLKLMTANLRFAKPLTTLPPPDGDKKFGLPIELRRQIFLEIAQAEPAARQAAKASFGGVDLAWSADDDRGSRERREVSNAATRHGISLTQAYMILDEGIHEKWPSTDGKPLEATTTALHPRRYYGW